MPSSSDDDTDLGSAESPPVNTQRSSAFDDEGILDLDDTLRRQRDAFRKQRMEKMARRRDERQRKMERGRRQQVSRGKKKNDEDDDDASASSGGSADLLAEASPAPSSAPSSPSPPMSPTSRFSSRTRNNANDSKTSGSQALGSAYARVNSKASDSSPSSILKQDKSGAKRSPSSPNRVAWRFGNTSDKATAPKPWRPKYDSDSSDDAKNGRKNTTTRNARLTSTTNNKPNSPSQVKKPWKPKYDSDSDDDNVGKLTQAAGKPSNTSSYLSQLSAPWKPKYDSDSGDDQDGKNKALSQSSAKPNNTLSSPAKKKKSIWKPKYDSDSGDDQDGTNKALSQSSAKPNNTLSSPAKKKKSAWKPKYNSDSGDDQNGTNKALSQASAKPNNTPSSPAKKKKSTWKPKYDSDSSDDNNIGSNYASLTQAEKLPLNGMSPSNVKNNNNDADASTNLSSPFQRKKPIWDRNNDTNDSEDEKSANENGKNTAPRTNKVSNNERRTTTTTKTSSSRRFAFESDSSSGNDFEDIKRKLRERNEERERKAAAMTKSSHNAAAALSPLQKAQGKSDHTAAVADVKRRRLAHLSDDSDDDDDDFFAASQRLLQQKKSDEQARLRAEKEASYKHNPLAMENREQEEREERGKRLSAGNVKGATASRTHAGAGGFEGTEIILGEEEEIKSISDIGDEACRRRRSNALTASDDSPLRIPSRGTYRRLSSRNTGNDTSDKEDSPTKKQRYSNQSSLQNSRSRMQLSDEDGLWDDSDEDAKKKTDDTSDSDNGAKKKGRGRGRPRAKRTSGSTTQQPGKRSTSKKAKAAPKSTADDCDDDDSDLTDPEEKQPQKASRRVRPRSSSVNSDDENTKPKKRSSNGSSRWNGRYGDDDQGDGKPVSEDELERLEGKLKPEFADPKLGAPGPLVPFMLLKTWERGDPLLSPTTNEAKDGDGNANAAAASVENNEVADKVPASTNRYLQEYQRVGIQFMYSSVMQDKGCVLGDDMGLGKTVQLISLISALLKKTGTGLDEFEINNHRNNVVKALRTREESKHQALLHGIGFGAKNEPAAALDAHVKMPSFTPILIVVPPSVAKNWQNEFETWGHFNVGVYSGPTREKALDRIKDGLDYILIVGKSLFVRAGDYDQLASVRWKLVIVDEFHEFKNGKSQGYMRLADLRDNAGCPIIGMTGTLMQNNHDELFYLIDLVRPFLLGDIRQFRNEVSKPVMYARAKDAKNDVMKLAEQQENLLRDLIRPAYLERKKEDVLKDSLTQKNEKVIFCELSDVQKKIYRHILTLPDFQHLRSANAPCGCGVNKTYFRGYAKMRTHKEQLSYQRRHKTELITKKKCCFKYPFNPMRGDPGEPDIDPDAVLWIQAHEKAIENPEDIQEDILDGKYIACQNCPTCITLQAMSKLYKISSHPALLQVDHCESGPAAKKKLQFAQKALTPDVLQELPGGTIWKSDGIMDNHIKLSGKMKSLDYLLRRYLKRRNRILVFSYSTATLDVIQNHIKTRGWTSLRLDGQTPTSARQSLVDQFQNGDTEIFLISTKAGGLGLNLTAANKVIIFDVNWNPSYDEQAQDRAYRIGQKRNVDAVRLVARGTIEELMYARQVYKVQLKKQTLGHSTDGKNQPQIFRGVAKDKNRKGELFGIENLLKFKDGSFMSSLWKKTDDPQQEHDVSILADQLDNMDEEKLDMIATDGDDSHKDTKPSPQKPQHDLDDDGDGSVDGIDCKDMFSETKGRARVGRNDENFSQEMGGESQMIEVYAKQACEMLRDEEDENDYTPPDHDLHRPAASPSPAKSSAAAGSNLNLQMSVNGRGDSTTNHRNAEFPSQVEKPSNSRGRVANNMDKCENCPSPIYRSKDPPTEPEKLTPARSTSDQSEDSYIEGLRTQPTTQQPSQSQKARSTKKRSATGKISIMGNIFENQPKNKKGSQLTKKSSGGLYIPSYSTK